MASLMKTATLYYIILFVYVCLWVCQQIVCHLTHSLIILTDSYINLYKILDISLGILHLKTQQKLRKQTIKESTNNDIDQEVNLNKIILFNHHCTYQFKRLPLIGSFVNGLFLAALLMSAAIEGIQTCFHTSHTEGPDAQKSILLQHRVTYPSILVGFSIVGLVMRWCSARAHEKREAELSIDGQENSSSTDSLFHSSVTKAHKQPRSQTTKTNSKDKELNLLNVEEIQKQNDTEFITIPLGTSDDKRKSAFRTKSAESIPGDFSDNSSVSLKSLKIIERPGISTISASLVDANYESQPINSEAEIVWALVRYCTSPLALLSCASIIYLIDMELVTEVADAVLAILTVILLFGASYPPMKRAGRVLLQTSPMDIDPEKLVKQIKAISPCIMEVREFYVWSLTSSDTSNRVATCHLVLNKALLGDDAHAMQILDGAKRKFRRNRIDCSTIQLIFYDPPEAMTTTTTNNNSTQIDENNVKAHCCES